MFSKFFINRPIFATVLALLIVVAGLVALNILPVAQFPEITPPTVQVSAVYPGANAETVAQTVGLPIEQQVNGVDGMLYMSSNSSSSGAYSLTITFAVGTDIDMATVQVQNRVSVAQSSLPEPVVVQGVTVQKQSSNIVMFLTMTSKDSVYNSLYLTNYAKLNLVDQLSRVPGVGAVNVMGAGDYSMRIWLDPEAMRIRNISPAQVYQSIQSQNMEVSAGYIGQPIGQDNKNAFQYTLNVQGRLTSPEQFGNIIIRREQDGAMLRLKDIARIDLGSASYSVVSRLKGMKRDAELYLNRFLLINMDEFDQIGINQQSFLKHILQKPVVNTRRPNASAVEELRRYASFIGTSNHKDLLTDTSGSRRFIGVEVTGVIDVVRPIDYEQLYAQAMALLRSNERYWFDEKEEAIMTEANREFELSPAIEQLFQVYYRVAEEEEEGEWLLAADILQRIQKASKMKISSGQVNYFGRILQKLGVKSFRKTRGVYYHVVAVGQG